MPHTSSYSNACSFNGVGILPTQIVLPHVPNLK